MQPAVVAQREAGSCRMSGEQAVRAGQVAPVATQRGPTPLQSTTSQGGSSPTSVAWLHARPGTKYLFGGALDTEPGTKSHFELQL